MIRKCYLAETPTVFNIVLTWNQEFINFHRAPFQKKHLLSPFCPKEPLLHKKYNPNHSQKVLPVMGSESGRNKRFQRCGEESLLPAQPLLNAQACDRSILLADWACIWSEASHPRCRTYRTVWIIFSVWQTPVSRITRPCRFSNKKIDGCKAYTVELISSRTVTLFCAARCRRPGILTTSSVISKTQTNRMEGSRTKAVCSVTYTDSNKEPLYSSTHVVKTGRQTRMNVQEERQPGEGVGAIPLNRRKVHGFTPSCTVYYSSSLLAAPVRFWITAWQPCSCFLHSLPSFLPLVNPLWLE